jgi:hypothetical protein
VGCRWIHGRELDGERRDFFYRDLSESVEEVKLDSLEHRPWVPSQLREYASQRSRVSLNHRFCGVADGGDERVAQSRWVLILLDCIMPDIRVVLLTPVPSTTGERYGTIQEPA